MEVDTAEDDHENWYSERYDDAANNVTNVVTNIGGFKIEFVPFALKQ